MRLSILHLIFACVFTAVFVVVMFATWQNKNSQVKVLNYEILAMQTKLNVLEEHGNKALAYVRIRRGLDVMSGRRLSERQKNTLTERLFEISTDYKIDPILILAVIQHESRGNPNARGAFMSGAESGALGLMQIKYESALEVARHVGIRLRSPEDLFNPEINLMVGTAYLLRLIAKYQDLEHALIAYNVGLGTLDSKLKTGTTLPTKYVNNVMREYRFLVERIW